MMTVSGKPLLLEWQIFYLFSFDLNKIFTERTSVRTFIPQVFNNFRLILSQKFFINSTIECGDNEFYHSNIK